MKQTITQKAEQYMKEMEENGTDVSKLPNMRILWGYYIKYHNMNKKDPVGYVAAMIETGNYPSMESVTRGIRKCRELNPHWRKSNKQEQVDTAKEEIGYHMK